LSPSDPTELLPLLLSSLVLLSESSSLSVLLLVSLSLDSELLDFFLFLAFFFSDFLLRAFEELRDLPGLHHALF